MLTQMQFDAARANLSQFILRKAHALQKQIGFGYADRNEAPSDYTALRAAYDASKRTGFALPVWSGGSDKTVYTSRGANYAFRFWHDVLHCVHGLDFALQNEIAIGHMHVAEVAAHFGPASVEAAIMLADTVRQSQHEALYNEFPADQLAFVWECVNTPALAECLYAPA